jgi:putative membrane protein
MKRSAFIALSLGLAVFVALLSWRGAGLIADTFVAAGWGIVAVALFHLVPLLFDASALHVLSDSRRHFMATLGARWAGEAVNSLMPAGQMGGPVVMARMLAGKVGSMPQVGAMVAVATTQQVLAQALFAMIGVGLLSLRTGSMALLVPLLVGIALFTISGVVLYRLQRRGLFSRLGKLLPGSRTSKNRAALARGAARLDEMINGLYRQGKAVRTCFLLNLAGWLVGTGEVWLALQFIGHPVSWMDALLLESLGQAVRGIAFAIPGALGVQEGGFLLLAPFVGLTPEAALALSLCKRARELILGLPGLAYWHWVERGQRRAQHRVGKPSGNVAGSPSSTVAVESS